MNSISSSLIYIGLFIIFLSLKFKIFNFPEMYGLNSSSSKSLIDISVLFSISFFKSSELIFFWFCSFDG